MNSDIKPATIALTTTSYEGGIEEYYESVRQMSDSELYRHCYEDGNYSKNDFCIKEFNKRYPKVLRLVVNGHWFKMIESEEKKEEYRTLKKYWFKRLILPIEKISKEVLFDMFIFGLVPRKGFYRDYDAVEFRCGNGKQSPRMFLKHKRISIGVPRTDWSGGQFIDESGQKENVFIISLGKKIAQCNCTES